MSVRDPMETPPAPARYGGDPRLIARRIVIDVLRQAATEEGPRGEAARAELEARAALRRAGQAGADTLRTLADTLRPAIEAGVAAVNAFAHVFRERPPQGPPPRLRGPR